MATITVTPIKTFVSGETVTPTKLNELAQSTVALTAGSIVAADIASDAVTNAKIASGVDASKLTTGTLPIARIADAAVTAAKLAPKVTFPNYSGGVSKTYNGASSWGRWISVCGCQRFFHKWHSNRCRCNKLSIYSSVAGRR